MCQIFVSSKILKTFFSDRLEHDSIFDNELEASSVITRKKMIYSKRIRRYVGEDNLFPMKDLTF